MTLWAQEEDTALRSYCAGTLSFSEIAARLSVDLGKTISRNACIGRARRLSLEKRAADKIYRDTKPKKPRLKVVTSPRTLVQSVVIRKAPNIAKPAELTKSQLRAMLADAVRNTARLPA
jgi:hypothetical protein